MSITAITSSFTSSNDGWTVVGDAQGSSQQPNYQTTGGTSDGFVSATDNVTGGTWYWKAPEKYLGDRSSSYGLTLSFQLTQSSVTSQFENYDVILEGAGIKLTYKLPSHPNTTWTAYSVALSESADWVNAATGNAASHDNMIAVLGSMTALFIRGEYRDGSDSGGLDSVILQTLDDVSPLPITSITSSFTSSNDGWTVVGDAQGGSEQPNYQATGGTNDGFVSATDNVTGGTWYWNAPEKYLGDRSSSYGLTLSFQLTQSSATSQFENNDVILEGAGIKLTYKLPSHPNTTWTAYSVALSETADWVNAATGNAASHDNMIAVLGSMTALFIRGEYRDGSDSGGLDSVSLQTRDSVIQGTTDNDHLTGTSGNDQIDGLGGTDTMFFDSNLVSQVLSKTASGWTVSSEIDGTDQLASIERLQFSDKKLALDLSPTEHAGQALEFIGLLAPPLVKSPSVVGIILEIFDQGQSMHDVCQLAIDVGLVKDIAGSSSNEALAAMSYRNLVGQEPDAASISELAGYMNGQYASYTQADFMTIVAGLELNQVHIGLVGLQQTGVEYV